MGYGQLMATWQALGRASYAWVKWKRDLKNMEIVAVVCYQSACSVGWFVSLLVREEVLLADLCERKILFWLKIYDRLRQATAKRTG